MATVIYAFLAYPGILAVLRRVASRPVSKSCIEPSVCLFITAHNEATVIEQKLRNSLQLDYPSDRLSIIVASDGSTDATNRIARTFASHRVKLLEFKTRRGKIAAIIDGMRSVDADVVVFTDANALLQPTAVKALVRNFFDPAVGAVSGDVVLFGRRAGLAGPEDLFYRYERTLQRWESETGSLIGVDGALFAIRTRLFTPPPEDTILDDMAIPISIAQSGYRVVFEPEARAHEAGCSTAWEEFDRKVRVMAGGVQFVARLRHRKCPHHHQLLFTLVSHKLLRWSSPVCALLVLIASLALAGESLFFRMAAFVQTGVFVVGLLGCVPLIRRLRVVGIVHYFCLNLIAAGAGLIRGLAGRQPVAWKRFDRLPPRQVSASQ